MAKQARKNEPLIGIWWDDGSTLAALAHQPDSHSLSTRLLDSDLQHVTEWPKVAKKFCKSVDNGYECVPRGRVIFDSQRMLGVIYHGSATTADRLERIAKKFQLTDWRAMRDPHYAFGAEIDQVFDDDY